MSLCRNVESYPSFSFLCRALVNIVLLSSYRVEQEQMTVLFQRMTKTGRPKKKAAENG